MRHRREARRVQNAPQLEVTQTLHALFGRRRVVLHLTPRWRTHEGCVNHPTSTARGIQLDATHALQHGAERVGGQEVLMETHDLRLTPWGIPHISTPVSFATVLQELVAFSVAVERVHGSAVGEVDSRCVLVAHDVTQERGFVAWRRCGVDYVECERGLRIGENIAEKEEGREAGGLRLQNDRQRAHQRMIMKINRRGNAKNTWDHFVLHYFLWIDDFYVQEGTNTTTAQLLLHVLHGGLCHVHANKLPFLQLTTESQKHLAAFFLREEIGGLLHVCSLHQFVHIRVDRWLRRTDDAHHRSAAL